MSSGQSGLGSRGAAGFGAAGTSFSLPLAFACVAVPKGRWEDCPVVPNALVALLRNGFSKASLMRLTLTFPKPGRDWSLSEGALAMLAKLWEVPEHIQNVDSLLEQLTPKEVRNVSTSVLLTLLMLVREARKIEL